jgi:hypothetical protein
VFRALEDQASARVKAVIAANEGKAASPAAAGEAGTAPQRVVHLVQRAQPVIAR